MKIVVIIGLVLFIGLNSLSKAEEVPFLQAVLKGQALVIDMDENDNIDKASVWNGKDLIVARIASQQVVAKSGVVTELKITPISQAQDIIDMDSNHDGIVEKKEMLKANLVLLRYTRAGEITLDSLAASKIRLLSYKKNHDGTVSIHFQAENNQKKFTARFISF